MANLLFTTTLADSPVNNINPEEATDQQVVGVWNETNEIIMFFTNAGLLPNSYYRFLTDESHFYDNPQLNNLLLQDMAGPDGGLIDFYFIIGNERMDIYYHNDPMTDSTYGQLKVTRGSEGTTAVAHSPGETVQFWGDFPDYNYDFAMDQTNEEESQQQQEEEESQQQEEEESQQEESSPTIEASYGDAAGNIKRLFRNKPRQNDLGVYTYLDGNDEISYVDSDSVSIQYDKFIGKDLYTTSTGHSINEAIMDSKIQNKRDSNVDDLKFTGETSVTIRNLRIENRGVRSRINDVYFRFFLFSAAYYNPKNASGSWRGYNTIVGALQGDKKASWFYNQNGPNYGDDGEPGDFEAIQNLRVAESFDKLNYTAVSIPESSEQIVYDEFNPNTSLKKIDGNSQSQYNNDLTICFQENGAKNNYYFAVHMDGDLNPKNGPDRSRNQTLSLFEFDPSVLFESTGDTSIGKVTELEWEGPDYQTHSTGKKAPAWTSKELKMTINTEGGVNLESATYTPPVEYESINEDIFPPLSSVIGKLTKYRDMDRIILNMFPTRQIMIESPTNPENNNNDNKNTDYYMGKFADFIPISEVNVSNRDCQVYYENAEDRYYSSAPNSVSLNFKIARHPFPYTDFCERRGCYTQYDYTQYANERWDYNESILLKDRISEESDSHYIFRDYDNSPGFTTPSYDEIEISVEETVNDSKHIFFVVHWNDSDNIYQTIEDVLEEWPRTQVELLEKQQQNLYIPSRDKDLVHNYLTPGIKIIKTILFSYEHEDNYFDDYPGGLEPLRWKLVTTRLFLDIPINEYPDFGEVGGADYTTIPWPYTAPVIGGISEKSKYISSINETLSGGKIGDQDIIDETFLVQSKNNDELGKNIERLDFEQIRFFNKSYDMNTLLKMPESNTMITNIEPSHLETLEFPQWYEEFDVNDDGVLDISDVDMWIANGRPDIGEWIENNIQIGDGMDTLSYEYGGETKYYWELMMEFFSHLGYQNVSLETATVSECILYFNGKYGMTNSKATDLCNDMDSFNNSGPGGGSNNLIIGMGTGANINSNWEYALQTAGFCNDPDGDYNGPLVELQEQIYDQPNTDQLPIEYWSGGSYFLGWSGYTAFRFCEQMGYDYVGSYEYGDYIPSSVSWTYPLGNWAVNDPLEPQIINLRCVTEQTYSGNVSPCSQYFSQTEVFEDPTFNDLPFGPYRALGTGGNGDKGTAEKFCNIKGYATYVDDSIIYDEGDLVAPTIYWRDYEWYDIFNDDEWKINSQPSSRMTSVTCIREFYVPYSVANPPQISDAIPINDINSHTFPDSGEVTDMYFVNTNQNYDGYIPISIRDSDYWSIYNSNKEKLFKRAENLNDNIPDYCQLIDLNLEPEFIMHCKTNWLPIYSIASENENEPTLPSSDFYNVEERDIPILVSPYYDISGSLTATNGYWNGGGNDGVGNNVYTTFSEETSVGQIFIDDNLDLDLVSSCKLELNTGQTSDKSIDDSSGNLNKGLLIGDYKIKKTQKNNPMKRDSFIKIPKTNNNKDGAL